VKIEPDVELVCSVCGVEGPHRLLYLSDHVRSSQCGNCGAVQMFTGRLYADYARDVLERGFRLPCNLAGRALRNPLAVFGWPVKGAKKPFGLLWELDQVVTLDRIHRHASSRHVHPGA